MGDRVSELANERSHTSHPPNIYIYIYNIPAKYHQSNTIQIRERTSFVILFAITIIWRNGGILCFY